MYIFDDTHMYVKHMHVCKDVTLCNVCNASGVLKLYTVIAVRDDLNVCVVFDCM